MHLESNKRRPIDLKRCHSCNDTALRTARYCLKCWIKECVRKTLGVKDKQEKEHLANLLLKKLKLQNHQCAYTGRLLVAGVNLSLDHVLPKSKFPESKQSIDNLVWVDLSCNVAKNNLLPNDFLSMCEDVVFYRSEILQSDYTKSATL